MQMVCIQQTDRLVRKDSCYFVPSYQHEDRAWILVNTLDHPWLNPVFLELYIPECFRLSHLQRCNYWSQFVIELESL